MRAVDFALFESKHKTEIRPAESSLKTVGIVMLPTLTTVTHSLWQLSLIHGNYFPRRRVPYYLNLCAEILDYSYLVDHKLLSKLLLQK